MKIIAKTLAFLLLTSATASASAMDLSDWILEIEDYGGISRTEDSFIFSQGADNTVRAPGAFDGASISFSVSGNPEAGFTAGFGKEEDDFLTEYKLFTQFDMLAPDVGVWLNDVDNIAYYPIDEIWADWNAAATTTVTYAKKEIEGDTVWEVSISSEGQETVVLASVSESEFAVGDYVPFFKVSTSADDSPIVVKVSESAVPEPGTCAAIFGALALALAIRRKRS